MGNASVNALHSNQHFLNKSKLRAVTITLKCPSLNPIENLITFLKMLVSKDLKEESKHLPLLKIV